MQEISIFITEYGETIEDINTIFYPMTYNPKGKTKESGDYMYVYI
jgi:hypothetical protein